MDMMIHSKQGKENERKQGSQIVFWNFKLHTLILEWVAKCVFTVRLTLEGLLYELVLEFKVNFMTLLGKQNWNIKSVSAPSSPYEIRKMMNLPASIRILKSELNNWETDKSYFHLPHQRNNKLVKFLLSCLKAS